MRAKIKIGPLAAMLGGSDPKVYRRSASMIQADGFVFDKLGRQVRWAGLDLAVLLGHAV